MRQGCFSSWSSLGANSDSRTLLLAFPALLILLPLSNSFPTYSFLKLRDRLVDKTLSMNVFLKRLGHEKNFNLFWQKWICSSRSKEEPRLGFGFLRCSFSQLLRWKQIEEIILPGNFFKTIVLYLTLPNTVSDWPQLHSIRFLWTGMTYSKGDLCKNVHISLRSSNRLLLN